MYATETDACREYARNVGREQTDRAWICTDFDTWERNPFYVGPPVKHPEDDSDQWEDANPADHADAALAFDAD